MLPRVLAIANYVGAYKRMGSADASAKVQADQAEHVMLLLKSEVLAVDDAAALISPMVDGGSILATFSAEQRQSMAAAVQVATTIAEESPAKAQGQTSQTHYFFHNYMSEGDWKMMLGNVDSYGKVNTLVTRALAIGLTHPSELTVVALIALITVTSRTPVHPETAHSLLKDQQES